MTYLETFGTIDGPQRPQHAQHSQNLDDTDRFVTAQQQNSISCNDSSARELNADLGT